MPLVRCPVCSITNVLPAAATDLAACSNCNYVWSPGPLHALDGDEEQVSVRHGYEELHRVLMLALRDAQDVKGKERHACEGEAFQDQKIVQLNRWIGTTHGAVYQAAKKAIESTRLPKEQAIADLLGAINYLAAAVLLREEE